MTRSDRLVVLLGGGALGAVILVAVVLNLRSPGPPEDLRRAFSTPVTVPEGMVTISIDMGAALERSGQDWFAPGGFEFEIREEDIVARSEAVHAGRTEGTDVLGARGRLSTGRGFDQHMVAVRFDDSWVTPSGSRPDILVLDAEGYELDQGSLGVSCPRDAQGRIGPGETRVEVVIDPDEVGVLTYVLGPSEYPSPC